MAEAIKLHTEVDRRAAARLVHRALLGSTPSSSRPRRAASTRSADTYDDDLP